MNPPPDGVAATAADPQDLGRWFVVGLGFLALSLAFSARATLGLVMPEWEATLGWTRSFISTGGALTLVVAALVSPIAGGIVDRYGPRRPLVFGLLAIAAGMAVTAAADAPRRPLVFGLLAGVGFGAVAVHVVSTVVARLFEANRGLATGVATSGATAGQLLAVPLVALVLASWGWRAAFVGVAVVALLMALLSWHRLPRRSAAERAAAEAERRGRDTALSQELRALLRQPVFHALFWSFTICGFTTAGVIEVHLLPYAALCGFPPLPSAVAYGVLSAFNMVGMVLAGYLADRVNRVALLSAIYLLRAACFVLLMLAVGDYAVLVVFAVLFGLFDYSTVPVTASLVASHIGLRVMGLTMGLLALGHALGGALGAFMGGVLFDLFARYAETWSAALALSALAGLIVLTIRERRTPALAVA